MVKTSEAQQPEQLERWPALPYAKWTDTCQTLHMWTQVVGKVRMELSPFLNHWWHVTMYVSPRGLTTSPIPYHGGVFDVTFDFVEQQLVIHTSDETSQVLPLVPCSVATFYRKFMDSLRALGIEVTINPMPCEVTNPIRCDEDEVHASYDPVYAERFWQILVQTNAVMQQHRSSFIGKSSPIHFFWGGFDLALTFFSGRRAPERPGADRMNREAYSHEVISCGFWPGDERFPEPAYYAYSAPEPPGFSTAAIQPEAAFYSKELGEFLLRYEDVRTAPAPEQALLGFFRSTYVAGSRLAHWDWQALERESAYDA